MENKKLKVFTLDEMKDKHIGVKRTEKREIYENELRMAVIGDLIRKTRLERQFTQEQLGKLVGVQKSQISKLENNANSASIDTIVKVFKALKAEINFTIKLENQTMELA